MKIKTTGTTREFFLSMHRLLMECYSVLNGACSQTGHQVLHSTVELYDV